MDFHNNYSAVNGSATDFTLRQTEVAPLSIKQVLYTEHMYQKHLKRCIKTTVSVFRYQKMRMQMP